METPTPNRPLSDIWQCVRDRLRTDVGDAAYNSWLKQLELTNIHDDRVLMSVPTRFMRDWVVSHYAEKIRTAWSEEAGAEPQIDILVRPSGQSAPVLKNTLAETTTEKPVDQSLAEAGAPLDPRCTFENFVVGKANELAYAAAHRVAEADNVPFNPLYLYGGVGLGKTHLMHAIAWHIRQRDPTRRVIYLSAEKFMYQFIRSLRYKDVMQFKQLFRSVDVLMIDDVQFISGKDSTQEEFFHTFNALVDQNRQVIISGDRSPCNLDGMEERMRSRLGWGLVADIHQTDYELRIGILQSKVQHMGAKNVPQQVLSSWPTGSPPMSASSRARLPGCWPTPTSWAGRLRWKPPKRSCATSCGPMTAGSPSKTSRNGWPSTTTFGFRKCTRRGALVPWPGPARWRCIWPSN